LKKQKLLISEWDTSESRPRKFYTLSDKGKEVNKLLKKEWRTIFDQLEFLMKEDEEMKRWSFYRNYIKYSELN
jgi:DNA-binding PadR family transcriptional regulator